MKTNLIMSKIKFLVLLIIFSILLCGCASNTDQATKKDSVYPCLQYLNSGFRFDSNNRLIELPDGYVLNQGYSYNIVATKDGCDVVIHLIKDAS